MEHMEENKMKLEKLQKTEQLLRRTLRIVLMILLFLLFLVSLGGIVRILSLINSSAFDVGVLEEHVIVYEPIAIGCMISLSLLLRQNK
jgi:lipopolysaccharide export LptBFGC system permease protein LptF